MKLIAIFFLLTSAPSYGAGDGSEYDAKPSLGHIHSTPAKIDFGKVKVGKKATRSFLIHNDSDRDIDQALLGGLSVIGDSGAFDLRAEDCNVLPKATTCKVTVIYRPRKRRAHSITVKTMGRITRIETLIQGEGS